MTMVNKEYKIKGEIVNIRDVLNQDEVKCPLCMYIIIV